MNPDNESLAGLLQPFSMEPRSAFLTRFSRHPEMIDLFASVEQREQMAREVFAARWDEAPVTVTKLDGEVFFID